MGENQQFCSFSSYRQTNTLSGERESLELAVVVSMNELYCMYNVNYMVTHALHS